ncbi:MAG: hypothetical protein VB118_09900 [Oscillospiraceae bacterium]|nr:hypothetical protein [Oscillospiraceae bacterium]
MKRTFLIIVSVLIIFCAFFSCEKAKTEENPTDQITGGDVASGNEDSNLKIAVSLPEGWNKLEGSVLEHQYMKNTASLIIKEESFSKKTLDGIVDEANEIFRNTFTGFEKVGENEYIKIGGKDAVKTSFTCKAGSFEMKYIYVYFLLNNKVTAITLGDLADTFDSLSSDYSYILEHITFTEAD